MADWQAAFPALQQRPHGQRLAFLDSAASAQKPEAVLTALREVLAGPYANIHRGLYFNSATTTAAFEAARVTLARFLGADPAGLIFTRNATESLNLVAQTWGRVHLGAKSVVVVSAWEHHANLVPWHLLQAEKGFTLRVLPLNAAKTDLDYDQLPTVLAGASLLAVTQMSNVTGARPDLPRLLAAARAAGATVVVDGSQGAVHGPQNLATLGADFYVGTGHKLYGPTGIGWLWGRPELLATLPPFLGGGDMIETVRYDGSTFAAPPARFEAGTPAIAEAIGLAAAADWLSGLGWAAIQAHEQELTAALEEALAPLPLVRYGPRGTGIVAFNVRGCHASDVATLLDQQGVAVRSGHHCAMPLMEALGVTAEPVYGGGCLRVSLGVSNTLADIAQLAAALTKAQRLLAGA